MKLARSMTMDSDVWLCVEKVCAQRGLRMSAFIEDAVKRELDRYERLAADASNANTKERYDGR